MPFKINNQIVNKQLLHLVPHGIDSKVFRPLLSDEKEVKAMRKRMLGDKQYDFVLFHNSRNIQRKKTSNTILAFRAFCDNLPKEQASKCVLLLHTERVSDAGTDLPAVIEAMCPNYDVKFTDSRLSPEEMNLLYNIADVTILISSNEGFGLSMVESIMAGTPIITNVTGGLQDQIGQTDDVGIPIKFNVQFATNSAGKYKNHGPWAKPVWPSVLSLQGSRVTPYIFDDICKWEDVADAIMYWYLMTSSDRESCGLKGREWCMGEGGLNSTNMCNQFIKAMDFTLEHFVPELPYSLHTTREYIGHAQPNNSIGVEIPKIDIKKIQEEINITISKL